MPWKASPKPNVGAWGGLISSIRRHVLTGTLVVMPLVIGFLPVLFIYPAVSRLARRLPGFSSIHEGAAFALTLLLVLSVLYVIGVLSATFVMRFVVRLSEGVLNQIPIVSWFYRMAKQVADLMALRGSKPFQRVVVIEYPRAGLFAFGFVTGESEHGGAMPQLVHVFVPTTPNPTSGTLVLLRPEDVREADIPVEAAVKFIISGGILNPGQMALSPYAFGLSAKEGADMPEEILTGKDVDQ